MRKGDLRGNEYEKIINMTVIGFIMFSLLLSFQPIVSEAKTNVATIVNEAKAQMKKPIQRIQRMFKNREHPATCDRFS